MFRDEVEIALYNRQRKLRIPLEWLRGFAPLALEECLKHPRPDYPRLDYPAGEAPPLPALEEVEVTFVSDATIARVHRDFMNIPGATDVITFAHGEIVISVETAQANGAHFGRPLHEELARYVVHGLLHLNGYEDETPADAKRMHQVQERVLEACLARFPKEP